mgnify:FL=1
MRCPSCGYTNSRKQQSIEAKIIFKDIPEHLRSNLIYIGKKLKSHFDKPTLNRHWNQLMYLIDIIDYDIVSTTVTQYLLAQYHLEGKGLPYLKTMIQHNAKAWTKKKQIESAKYDNNPPNITKKEK